MDDRADKAYAAWPERIYVIARGGRIEYKAGPGPFGFEPDEAAESLARLLARGADSRPGGWPPPRGVCPDPQRPFAS
jgi:hypothetical protein